MITLDEVLASFHSIAVKDSANGYELNIDSNGYITVNQGTSPWVVSATDLDIRGLNVATDGDHVYIMDSTGTNALAIDASGFITANINGDVNVTQGTDPWIVSATDFDIRDLTHVSDSVKIGDGTDFLEINADGSINVVGQIEVTSSAYDTWKVTAASVGSTESELVATPLTGRLRIEIQNLGSNDVYLKEATGVTTANGVKLPKGSSWQQELDDGADIFAITPSGTTDLRIVEYSA